MKLLFFTFMVIMSFGCTSGPKQPLATKDTVPTIVNAPDSDTVKIIQHIKDVYAAINQEKLTQKSFEWETDTTCEAPPMGGTLTYYYRGDEIVKMLSVGGEDHGSWKEEYYFANNQLVFVYQNNTYGGAANPDEVRYQNRYYFSNNQLVKKMETEAAVQSDARGIEDLSKTIYRLKEAGNSAAIARIFSCNPE